MKNVSFDKDIIPVCKIKGGFPQGILHGLITHEHHREFWDVSLFIAWGAGERRGGGVRRDHMVFRKLTAN